MRYRTALLLMATLSAAAVRAGGMMALDPSRQSQLSAQDPNSYVQDPNVPAEVLAEGVIAVEAATPVVSVMTAATEAPAFTYRLTYRADERIDESSWTYYQPFLAVDPNHLDQEPDVAFLAEQLSLEPAKMNLEALAAHFEACKDKLALLEQAVRCRRVVWPKIQTTIEAVRAYRRSYSVSHRDDPSADSETPIVKIADVPTLLAQLDAAGLLLSAKARYHIANGEYEIACRWLRAALACGRQMANDADAIVAMTGAVNVGRALGQIEAWVQKAGSPSLFRALGDVPRPLVVFSSVREYSRYRRTDGDEVFDSLEVEPGFLAQSPRAVQNIERLIAALQCVEAIRLHAALYEGRIPEVLTEISDVRVPLDPVTRQPFVFERHERGFTLSSETGDGDRRVELRYRIIREPKLEYDGIIRGM